MLRNLIVKSALVALVCTVSVCAYAMADTPRPIDVPPGDLATALLLVSKKTGVELVFNPQQLKGIHTKGVSGTLSSQDAVRKLLEGTKLELRTDSATGAMMIGSPPATPGAAATGPASDPPLQEAANNSSQDLRVAQTNQGASPENASRETKKGESETEKKQPVELEEVVVTGSHIRGTSNDTAPLMVIDRADIERSGYATTQEFIASLPQNFSGGAQGATEDGQLGPGLYAGVNSSFATGVNLRGLGATATLVLIDGHRVAPSASGIFVDVSAIPLEAIERVEIVADGASAIYGADAIGGVVNFVLRKDFSGQETTLKYGAASGDTRTQAVVGQSIGRDWSDGGGLFTFNYQKLGTLPSTDRRFTDTITQPTDLLPESHQYSGLVSLHQTLGAGFDVASDILYTRRDDFASQTTSAQTTTNSPLTNEESANVVLGWQPSPNGWRIEGAGLFSRQYTDIETLYMPPQFPQCADTYCHTRENYKVSSPELNANGGLFELPGGEVRAAVGATYRREIFAKSFAGGNTYPPFDRHVTAEYGELAVPIVGDGNQITSIRSLSLSLAVRHDDYSDFGPTTNPRVGISWKPADSLHFRGAYSTSFRAPNSLEVANQTAGYGVETLPFAGPAGGTVPTFLVIGATGTLQPEKARNISFGADYSPTYIPNLKASVNFWDIRYRDQIIQPPLDFNALLNPSVYGSLITSFPNDAAAQAFLNQIVAQGGVNYGASAAGVRYAYNFTQQNAAITRQRGLDFTIGYDLHAGASTYHAGLNAAYIDHILTQFTNTSEPTDLLNTYYNPLKWRGRLDLAWARGPYQISGAVNFASSYTDTTSANDEAVPSWTTVDLRLAYAPPALKGFTVGISAINVFNRDPPFVVGAATVSPGLHYDIGNANPLGRVLVADLRLQW